MQGFIRGSPPPPKKEEGEERERERERERGSLVGSGWVCPCDSVLPLLGTIFVYKFRGIYLLEESQG